MRAHTHTCVHTHINTHTPPGRALSPGLPDDEHYLQKYLFPVGPVMKTLLRYYFKCADREKGDTGYTQINANRGAESRSGASGDCCWRGPFGR